jgi:TRAP-type C4-dicarboxylate transport system permease small subunit
VAVALKADTAPKLSASATATLIFLRAGGETNKSSSSALLLAEGSKAWIPYLSLLCWACLIFFKAGLTLSTERTRICQAWLFFFLLVLCSYSCSSL